MKCVLRLLFVLAALQGIEAAVAQTVVLDDFATFRKNSNAGPKDYCNTTTQDPANYSNCLWPGQPNQGPTICAVPTPGALVCTTQGPAANGLGFWMNTLACDVTNCYDDAGSRLPAYIKSGTWIPTMNRYRFTYKCSVDIPSNGTSGNHWLEIGTYIRQPAGSGGTGYGQGTHYYQFLNSPSKANEWVTVELNRTVQHMVTRDPNQNWLEDPEWNAPTQGAPSHYYDGMTHFYFGPTYGTALQASNVTCSFGPMTLAYVSGEPDAYVSGITGTYNPTSGNYDLSWNTAKHVARGVTFDVKYSTSSMRTSGWSTGTSAGSVTGQDDSPYTEINFSTPAMARAPTLYVAIRPRMPVTSVTMPSQIQLTTNVEHFLSTGDTVTINGVCANADGNHTVTVVDSFNLILNGTSGACSYTSGGTIMAVDDTRNFSELQIGGQSTPQTSASCDINGDGSMNVLDVQASVNAALGISSCTPVADLKGDGHCDVIDVQRVITASLGGACKVGP